MCEECSRNVENMSGIAAAPEEGRGLLFPPEGMVSCVASQV